MEHTITSRGSHGAIFRACSFTLYFLFSKHKYQMSRQEPGKQNEENNDHHQSASSFKIVIQYIQESKVICALHETKKPCSREFSKMAQPLLPNKDWPKPYLDTSTSMLASLVTTHQFIQSYVMLSFVGQGIIQKRIRLHPSPTSQAMVLPRRRIDLT